MKRKTGVNGKIAVITALIASSAIAVIQEANSLAEATTSPTSAAAMPAASSSAPTSKPTSSPAEILKALAKKHEPILNISLNGETMHKTVKFISEQTVDYGIELTYYGNSSDNKKKIDCDFVDEPLFKAMGTLAKDYDLKINGWGSKGRVARIGLSDADTHDNSYVVLPMMLIMLGTENEKQEGDQDAQEDADTKTKTPPKPKMKLGIYTVTQFLELHDTPKAYVITDDKKKRLQLEGRGSECIISGKLPQPGQKIHLEMQLDVLEDTVEVRIPMKEGKFTDPKTGYEFTIEAPKEENNSTTCKYNATRKTKGKSQYNLMWQQCVDEDDMEIVTHSSGSSWGSNSFDGQWTFPTSKYDASTLTVLVQMGQYKTIPFSADIVVAGQPTSAPTSVPATTQAAEAK